MEERGEREERIVDIYVSADDPDPGTQHAVKNTGDSETKKNLSRVFAVCLVLLCVLLLAVIIALVVNNFELIKENDNLTAEKDQIQSSFYELQTRHNTLTEQQEDLKRRLCDVLPGWRNFAYSCYFISLERKSWEDSRQYCRDRHSDLMVINSQAEQEFVEGLNQRVWLGLTDREEEGKFKWVDGTPLTAPAYWYPGEPTNGKSPTTEEDCVELYNGNDPSIPGKGWNDGLCSANLQWICERVVIK